jgi:glutathione S-transferase
MAASWAALAESTACCTGASSRHFTVAGRRGNPAVRDLCEGPPSAQALLRTFGSAPGDVRVTLYRDTHAWCPYCHKVWMQLEEKQIPYRVEKINMRCYGPKKRSFLAKVPQGMLPVLEIEGAPGGVITESSVIMSAIEETFPDHRPLLPTRGSPPRREAERLLALERALFGSWLRWLRAEDSARARAAFEEAMDATDAELHAGGTSSGGPYFMGEEFTLVDCVFASTLERIAASVLYYKGLQIKAAAAAAAAGGEAPAAQRWAGVQRWFVAMETRPAYRASQSDFHTHVHDLPPQIGGCLRSGERLAGEVLLADTVPRVCVSFCGGWVRMG